MLKPRTMDFQNTECQGGILDFSQEGEETKHGTGGQVMGQESCMIFLQVWPPGDSGHHEEEKM